MRIGPLGRAIREGGPCWSLLGNWKRECRETLVEVDVPASELEGVALEDDGPASDIKLPAAGRRPPAWRAVEGSRSS